MTPKIYWSIYGSNYPNLQPLAKRIFSLVPRREIERGERHRERGETQRER
jgi:hypothetical protein